MDRIYVPSGWKSVVLRQKSSQAKFLFRERIFIFRDRTVVKIERSEILAVQIKEKENSLKEKKSLRGFISKIATFFSYQDTFFLQLSVMTPTISLQFYICLAYIEKINLKTNSEKFHKSQPERKKPWSELGSNRKIYIYA